MVGRIDDIGDGYVKYWCKCGSMMAILHKGSSTTETCSKCGDTISAPPLDDDDEDDIIEGLC